MGNQSPLGRRYGVAIHDRMITNLRVHLILGKVVAVPLARSVDQLLLPKAFEANPFWSNFFYLFESKICRVVVLVIMETDACGCDGGVVGAYEFAFWALEAVVRLVVGRVVELFLIFGYFDPASAHVASKLFP